jgi:FG-GAP-like repeat
MLKRNGKRKVESGKLAGEEQTSIWLSLGKSGESFESIKSVESRVREEASIWRSLGKMERIFAVGIVALLSLSVFGFAISKYEDRRMKDESSANALNATNATTQNAPNTQTPVTSTTPTLSKEYIYAGSRMLAVEDANANASPPADLAVWRPSNGYFYVLGGPNSAQTFVQWGISTDVPVPGDYDGDGKTDFSIYRPSDGFWWIVKSSSPNESISLQFGAACTQPAPNSCDKVAPADYDGDGKTDAAVFRPSNGSWYFLLSGSGNSFHTQQFGLATDLPAPGDYDGDGKADIGVWRDSNKTFYSSNSSSGQLSVVSVQTASGNNTPISADYDGDGRADYAVRSGNNWVIKGSSNNQLQTIAWQTSGEINVQNDYDGDGKVDIATWNNSTGIWSIRQSGSNNSLLTVQWGTAGDIPVPAYYRR